MTTEETAKLARIEAVLREAVEAKGVTEGPWDWTKPNPLVCDNLEDQHNVYPPLGESGPVCETSGEPNARFIARSRTLLPAVAKALLVMIADYKEDIAYSILGNLRAERRLSELIADFPNEL